MRPANTSGDRSFFWEDLDRRTCLRRLAACCGSVLLGPLLVRTGGAAPGRAPLLAVVHGDRAAATRRAIELLGGMERFVPRGSRVVLKPNMSFPHPPERATNTHPEVVATIARMCRSAGAGEVLVLDFPFNPPNACLSRSGIRDACASIKGVHTVAITAEKFFRPHAVPRGKVLREVQLMGDVLDSDVLINLPTAKSHTTTGVSLGMKGLMGLIWDRRYFHAKVDINQAIADLSSAVKVDLIVLDASRALNTAGPGGPGVITRPGRIIAGTDPVAVDAAGVEVARWYGQAFLPLQVRHIAAACDLGLGTVSPPAARVVKARL